MPDRRPRPEARDVSARGLLLFAGGFAVFIAATLAILALLFDTSGIWPPLGPAHEASTASPALQRSPKEELAAFRRRETAELSALRWVDEDAGLARIPVEAAMRIIARRGLPDWSRDGAATTEDCRRLRGAVPRAPQAATCGQENAADGAAR